MRALQLVAGWDVPNAAAAVVAADGAVVATIGDIDRQFRLASLTKVVVGLGGDGRRRGGDDRPRRSGRSARLHAAPPARPCRRLPDRRRRADHRARRRRIYSNTGIELAAGGDRAARVGLSFADYLARCGAQPPRHGRQRASRIAGAAGCVATADDLARLLAELQRPTLLSADGAREAVTIQFPTSAGIVPGVGRFDPCPWGLGIEIRGDKTPHWTGTTNSPATFGHFGAAGTMLWVDPVAGCGLVALTDRALRRLAGRPRRVERR